MAGKTDYAKLHKRFVEQQRRQAELADDDRWLKLTVPQPGAPSVTYRMRFLPPPDGYDSWYMEYGVHYQIKNDLGNYVPVTCPLKTLKKPCPICEFVKGLWRSGTAEDKALAGRIGVKTRFVSNVVLLNNPSEVKLWSYGTRVWTPLNHLCVGSDGEFVPIDDPQNGYNFKVVIKTEVTADGNFPDYTILPDPMKPCPIVDKSVLTKIHPMHEIIASRVRGYDELRSLLFGSSDANASSDPAGAAPKTDDLPIADAEVSVEPESEPEAEAEVVDKEPTSKETSDAKSAEGKRPNQEELVKRAKAMLAKRAGAQA